MDYKLKKSNGLQEGNFGISENYKGQNSHLLGQLSMDYKLKKNKQVMVNFQLLAYKKSKLTIFKQFFKLSNSLKSNNSF